MAGLSTNAPGLWGGFAGLLYGSTSLSTPPGFLADATPAWVPAGGVLAFEFDNGLGYNSRNLATTTPDSILTYTNPSAKMVYGDDGVLGYAPHNLLTNSNWAGNYSGDDWTPTGWAYTSATGTGTAATSARSTSDLSIRFETTAARQILSIGFAVVGGMNYRLSFDLEAMPVAINWLQIFTSVTVGATIITYNGTGTNGLTPPTAGMIGTRVYIDFTAGSTGTMGLRLGCGVSSNITGDITISRPMITNLPIPGQTYFQNTSTTAAVYSLPIDHNPTTFEPLGVLIEEQRTNLLQWSEQFNDAAWAKAQATVTANSAIAPDGTTTADTLLDTAVSNIHYISQTVTGSPSGVTYTVSAYLKASTLSYATIGLSDISSGSLYAVAVFNLSSGAVATSGAAGAGYSVTSSSITSVGNGWYRCVATVVAGTSVAFLKTVVGCNKTGVITGSAGGFESYLGNGSGIYIWGAQLEAGAFPTSYIPTVASQVTRAADQVSILTSAFGYNATAGTMVVEARVNALKSATNRIASLYGPASRLADLYVTVDSNLVYYKTSDSSQVTIGPGVAAQTPFKGGIAYKLNDYQGVLGGTLGGADTSTGALPTNTSTLGIGNWNNDSASILSGHIKRLTYFPTRRSNADLQVLTT